MLRKRLGAVALIAVALTACSSTAEPERGVLQPSPPPAPVRDSTPSLTIDSAPLDDPGPCAGAVRAHPVSDPTEVEQLGGSTLAAPFDRGPMPHANGTTVLDTSGTPVAYEVAPDDVMAPVGARLCVGEGGLRAVNAVRRDGDALVVGDVMNLDAHTIRSVGDQNGVVHDNALPAGFVIPPQR